MTQSSAIDFYKSFNFDVLFVGRTFVSRAGFMLCSGISAQMQIQEVSEGGYNDMPHQIPKGTRYAPVTLERGMSDDTDLIDTYAQQYNLGQTFISINPFEKPPLSILIRQKDRAGNVKRTYELVDSLVTGWKTGEFNAMQSSIMLETVTINFSRVNFS